MTKIILGRAHNSLQESYSETTLRALCHSSKHTCCLATNQIRAHYHAATTVVYMAPMDKENHYLKHTHMLEQTVHICGHILCISMHMKTNNFQLLVLCVQDCFLVLHRETNLSNIKLINIHTD